MERIENQQPYEKQPTTWVVYLIIAINILIFCYLSLSVDSSILSVDNSILSVHDLALSLPMNPRYHEWQWVTSIFTHTSLMHLLFNMYALWVFGAMVQLSLGAVRFCLLYLLSAMVGAGIFVAWQVYQFDQNMITLLSYGVSRDELIPDVFTGVVHIRTGLIDETTRPLLMDVLHRANQYLLGASGAIFGVIVAFARLYPNIPLQIIFIPIDIKAKYIVLMMVVYELFAQLSGWSIFGDNIAHLVHLGGAVVGFLLASLWKKSVNRQYWV